MEWLLTKVINMGSFSVLYDPTPFLFFIYNTHHLTTIHMNLKEFQKELQPLVEQHQLDRDFNLPCVAITDYIMDSLNALMKANLLKPQSDGIDDFIERMYLMYPTRCPKRNASLGKTKKDKDRIRKLLKCYSMEEIERVIKNEIETKQGKAYMQNFSTFLNNFPDPQMMATTLFDNVEQLMEVERCQHTHQLNIGGVTYR